MPALRGLSWLLLLGGVRSSSSSSSSSHRTSLEIAATTRRWVDKVVIGKKLCPWAKQVYDGEGLMRMSVLPELTAMDWRSPDINRRARLSSIVLSEARALAQPQLAGHTTLLVLPNYSPEDFESYLELSNGVEELLSRERSSSAPLSDSIQLATFHPRYQFAGLSKTAPENYTNRAPFPILHLLRVDDVRAASAQYERHKGAGSTDEIWKSNVETMRALGLPQVRRLLRAVTDGEGA